tara:strand:- start:466 stop:1116 length:651 start_codon:yes stop_codon:yes gene_type:complete
MRKIERAIFIREKLNSLYPNPQPPLLHKNDFELLVAVLLSAQCTDERVNQVTTPLFKDGGDPLSMLRLGIKEIQQIIRPCGLSQKKSSAIVELSRILIEKHRGNVPATYQELEGLPGVGHKTASVVMSQGFGFPAFPVDTHIHRLGQRWGLTNGKNVEQTERDLKNIFPKENWNQLHLQFIFYGREFCTARGCDGRVCEICRTCYPKRRKALVTKK